ncbi:MAG: hypothetical protein WCO11_04680 [Sphingomonadales bacterium]|jgi:hypothetical protein
MNTRPASRPGARSAKTRPLPGVLTCAGRSEIVVVTAHEKRLVINVEADISAISLAKVRRDAGLNLVRTDRRDWRISFDTLPPPDSWVHDLPLRPQPDPARRAVLVLLALVGGAVAMVMDMRDRAAAMAAGPLMPRSVSDGICRNWYGGLGQCQGGMVQVALAPRVRITGWGPR